MLKKNDPLSALLLSKNVCSRLKCIDLNVAHFNLGFHLEGERCLYEIVQYLGLAHFLVNFQQLYFANLQYNCTIFHFD